MPVLKRRPRVSLIAPRSIEIGSDALLRAIVECTAPLPVRAIDLDVAGRAVWITQSQYGDQRNTSDFHRAGALLHAGGELPRGRHELVGTVRFPTGLPGSYRGGRIQVEYIATVKVDIPWWPDAAESFELHVAASEPPPQARPTVLYSTPDGPDGRKPYFELSLPTTELVPGSRLEIAASFGNVEHNRYRALEIALCAIETSKGFLAGGTSERSATRWVAELDGVREGEPFRTRIVVPFDTAPAFELERIQLAWTLRARARVGWGRDPVVEVPVTIHTGEPAQVAAVQAPPEVGSGRVADVWRSVGVETGLVVANGVLAGAVGAARVTIWRELSGRRGPHLMGEIRFPDLRIGLELDGRRRRPAARDPGQAEILADRLTSALEDAGAESAGDREIRCGSRASGARRAALMSFVRAVTVLARDLAATRAILPPPARLAAEIEGWHAAAAALGAELEVAGPSLAGTRDGTRFEIGAACGDDGEPDALEIVLAAPAPIDRRHHIQWQESHPRPEGEAVAALCDSARTVEIDRDRLRVRYSRELGPQGAAAELPGLAALVRALCGPPAGGAYR